MASFTLTSGTGASKQVYEFFTEGIDLCVTVESVTPRGEESPEYSTLSSCSHHSGKTPSRKTNLIILRL